MFLFTLVNADGLTTGVAIFGKHAVKAGETVRPSIPHDVSMGSQLQIALVAGKVLHVPGPTLGLGALIRKYDLQNRLAILVVAMNNGVASEPRARNGSSILQTCIRIMACTYLVAGRASWFYGFCMMPPAKEFAVLVEVDEIHQQFLADGAVETAGMPRTVWAETGGHHANVAAVDATGALRRQNVYVIKAVR
jgi:hypothetical protein